MEQKQNSILVVDDEAPNIAVLNRLLGSEYVMYAAKDGKTALSMAKKHLPDLILLDIVMPDMNGYAVLSELKAITETKEIPVIFITGLYSSKDEEKALALDAADYISKPFSDVIVKLRVRNQIKIVNSMRTIEHLRKKEREARKTNQIILDAAPLIIGLWDDDYNTVSGNKYAMDILGVCETQGFAGELLYSFSHEHQPCGTLSKEKARQLIGKAYQEGHSQFEWMHKTATGESLPVEVIVKRFSLDGKDMLVSYSLDLREEKRRESAEEKNRAKSRFLAHMSHEIRTPMNSVMSIAELQLQNGGQPPEIEEAFSRIYNSSSLLLSIINDMLDISKIEADKMEITPTVYEVVGLIVDTVQLNRMHIGGKHIEFKLEVDGLMPSYLAGDEHRVKQILNNLLSNAFKYTHKGQVTLSFGIKPAENPDEAILVLCVRDTGQGMSQEQIDNLFEADFTRFNEQDNRAIEGNGLGMMITHHLVTIMRGTITVDSILGESSTFTVCLPQKLSGTDILGKDLARDLQNFEVSQVPLKNVNPITRKPMSHGRVLVVDDVESNLYVAKSALEPYQIDAETVTSGYAAIEKIKAGEVYDIIFMDHMMPDMDGIEATKIIREMGYKHPIVALTANAVKGVADTFLCNGFDDAISKPIDLGNFDKCLIRYIRDK